MGTHDRDPLSPLALFGLSGRVAVVTGATGRLGTVMTRTLAAAGARVWAVARDQSRLDDLAADLDSGGLACRAWSCDVTVDADVHRLADAVRAAEGRLDVLVHNAHVGRAGTLATARPADVAEATDLALSAFIRLVNATRDLLAAAPDSASVITVASMYGLVSPRLEIYPDATWCNPPAYGAAKAGLLQLTRYAAVELARAGIRVNALTPGAFPADAGEANASLRDSIARHTPLGRVGSVEEIATALLFLASPRSSFVTGSNVVVDGGWTAW